MTYDTNYRDSSNHTLKRKLHKPRDHVCKNIYLVYWCLNLYLLDKFNLKLIILN